MTSQKSVLVIGLDPALIDFSQPGYAPGARLSRTGRRRERRRGRAGCSRSRCAGS